MPWPGVFCQPDPRPFSQNERLLSGMIRIDLLLLLLVLEVQIGISADLIQVQVLARHGLRNPFERDELEVWDDGGQLSGHGFAQMLALGAAFHDRYASRPGPGWNQTELARTTMVRSTDSLTSMMSATAFTLGLVPPGSGPVDELTGKPALPGQLDPVGVHTVPMPLDIPLRSYDKCPIFLQDLDTLMNSTEIAAWQSANGPALAKLGQYTRVNVTAVTFLDAFEIIAVEHAFGKLENITDSEYMDYEKMAAFLAEKMFTGVETNRMLAGRLLANMGQQIGAAVNVHNVTIPFIYLSGQYPTILATFSALGVRDCRRTKIPVQLPSPGSALIVELYQDSPQSFSVKVVVHDPARGHNFTEIALDRCGSQVACPVDRFMTLLAASSLADPTEWCALCNNTMTPPCNTGKTVTVPVPGPCSPVDPSEAGSGTASSTDSSNMPMNNGQHLAYAILTGMGFGLILAIVIFAMIRCAKSGAVSERLLPRMQEAWRRRATRTPNHVELQP